jgi:hypothetical protein
MPQTSGVYLGLFADDTCIYATDCKECYVLRKLQQGLSTTETWCERWNIKINEDTTQAIYHSNPTRRSSYTAWMEYPLCQSCKISRCNLLKEDYMETAHRND